jgi:hypothetical protein
MVTSARHNQCAWGGAGTGDLPTVKSRRKQRGNELHSKGYYPLHENLEGMVGKKVKKCSMDKFLSNTRTRWTCGN